MKKAIRIHRADNVAVALERLSQGDELCLEEKAKAGKWSRAENETGCRIRVCQEIPQGHKVALEAVAKGETIIKYGQPIGEASEAISPGEWVHTHNMKTRLSGKSKYVYEPEAHWRREADPGQDTFLGFWRKEGCAGVRNEIWILPAVGCVNGVAQRLAAENQDLVQAGIDGLYAFCHPYGCSQTGDDHENTRKMLAALAKHPNAAAVLVVHLGCENLTCGQFKAALGEYDPERIRFLCCQDEEDELAAGRRLLKECAAYAAGFSRQPISTEHLVVGLKCGGSDGLSGITANPAVGNFSDRLIAAGGTALLTEVPEMFGAEQLLLNRCCDRQTFSQAAEMIGGFREYFLSHGERIDENPSPGNKAGGITTLEDKSCGCVQKGGTMPVSGVLRYGDRVEKRGLNLLCGPGNDLVSATALTAAGAQIILFTTGRGTPFGAPAPTIKISSNTALARKKSSWIDFDAAAAAAGGDSSAVGEELYRFVLEIASGKQSRNEKMGFRQIAIWKNGVTL